MTISRADFKRLAAESIARAEAEAAIKSSVKADTFVQQFISMTPSGVAAYVDGNITDLASAKLLLRRMALMLLLLARKEYRD